MMGKMKRRLNNKGAVKSLTIFMIISVVLIGSFFSFFFSTAALNNGQIPAQYQSLINAYTSTNPKMLIINPPKTAISPNKDDMDDDEDVPNCVLTEACVCAICEDNGFVEV